MTKAGNHNWLLNVDFATKEYLLNKRRLCIDFERVRVEEYIPIIRCYHGQEFGHLRNKCENQIVCPRCAGNHHEKDCKTTELKCRNCYFEGTDRDASHRADSLECEAFKNYLSSIIRRL